MLCGAGKGVKNVGNLMVLYKWYTFFFNRDCSLGVGLTYMRHHKGRACQINETNWINEINGGFINLCTFNRPRINAD